jgi:hypothetical protein
VLNKGKPSREHTYPAIRAALCALLRAWRSPFALADVPQGCRIQATACDITGAPPGGWGAAWRNCFFPGIYSRQCLLLPASTYGCACR